MASTDSPDSSCGDVSTGDDRLATVWKALETVPDPEVPVINVVDLGIIADVRIEEGAVAVDMTPTFAGCPALDVIRGDIARAIEAAGESRVTVNIVYDPPWTTDRLSEEGRQKLKAFGLVPPQKRCQDGGCEAAMPDLEHIACPYCDSANTELESLFGPTLCRSIHYCHACLQSFEHFKAV